MPGRQLPDETTTVSLKGSLPFPDPVAVLSLRDCAVYRAVDEFEQPILILTDGVTTVALECGPKGLAGDVAETARRLADGVRDFSQSVSASVGPAAAR